MTPVQIIVLALLGAGTVWIVGYEIAFKLIVLLRYAKRERDARNT